MYDADEGNCAEAAALIGKRITVIDVTSSNYTCKEINHWWFPIKATDPYLPNNLTKFMNTMEKYALVFKPEPQKSFRKAGLTTGEDILTDEGQKIFLSWLLNKKYAVDFKKEVVDDMLALKDED